MIFEQMVDIPADRRLTLDVPCEVPAGRAILTFTPAAKLDNDAGIIEAIPEVSKGNSGDETFRRAIRMLQGAWKDNPWENCIEDIRAMREEWAHRDPWNSDPSKRHID
jgi:hypothetical protein